MESHITRIHERIRITHELLALELEVSLLIDHLYGKGSLTDDDVERIVAEVTRQDKAKRFLRIMKHKSEDMNQIFIDKLMEPDVQPHLAEAVLKAEVPDEEEDNDENKGEAARSTAMRDWSVEDVCRWLESLNLHRDIVSCFNEHNISGITLANVTESKIQRFCPVAKFGDMDKILQSRDDKLAERPANEPKTALASASELGSGTRDGEIKSEAFQRFGCRSKASYTYSQNKQLILEEPEPDKLLDPRHWFVDNDEKATMNVRDFISSGVIPFICACLNDRANGTCHIGVDRARTIHGIRTTGLDFQAILKELIDSCFYQDQLEVVKKCVQPVRLVEVITPDQSHSDRLYVVEIDVISSYTYCTDEAFFAKIPKMNSQTKEMQYGALKVFTLIDGKPQPVSGPGLVKFMENKDKLALQRKKQEEGISNLKEAQKCSQLSEKLEHLLCLNNDDVYPVFVTGPMPAEQASSDDFVRNIQFLKSIERKVVFDFDNASQQTSLYCDHEKEPGAPTRVLIIQSTDDSTKDKPMISTKEHLSECYDGSTLQPWIFCNGHQPTSKRVMDVREWKHNRRPDFLRAVEYFNEAIRPEYMVVVFLLFSNNYEIMLSAAEEFCLKFPDTWVLICETKEISFRFKEYLVRTQQIIKDDDEFDQHCIIGMPWLHVDQAIIQKLGNISAGQSMLPTSTGGTIEMSKRLLNDLGDLEILSADHLSNLEISMEMKNADKLRTMKQEKQKRFYQGDEVDWWNFWFESHVLRRDILGKLLESTSAALSGLANETGERVSVIAIYHQPGSGGTTVAKNVLWDLKAQYRCAVVKNITSDTSDQISRLFREGEPSKPKSVLLLLDNFDEMKVRNLKASLENEARNLSKEVECPPPVPFVLLICIRCSSESRASQKICHRRHNIEHNLSPRELTWFKEKYEEIEKKFLEDESLDPRVLISFNILRENFNPAYITNTVPRLVALVTHSNERLLLKYVAFLGIYDPDCQYIPASCFDCFMSNTRCFDGSPAWMPSNSKWTNRISDYLKVLLNEDSRKGTGLQTRGIKIIHSLISYEVYRQLVAAEVPASAVMLEFLHSEMFHHKDLCSKELLKIVYSVSIKRTRGMDGQYQSDFSPLIQGIVNDPKQDKVRAVEILKRAYHLTKNVFIAQHLARLYNHFKEWKSAEGWAKAVTTEHPKESVLWNTYGHVFRQQLNHRFQDKAVVTAQEVEESLDLVSSGLLKFMKEQELLDSSGSDSVSALLSQGSVILRFIEILTRIPELKDKDIHEFLLYPGFVPQCLATWSEKSVKFVKHLERIATKTREELESDRFYPQQADNLLDYENKPQKYVEQIAKTTEGIRNYFGEDSNETPQHLSPEQGVYYRRRRIVRLDGDKLTKILQLLRLIDFQRLQDINHLADENLHTSFRDIRDLISCIGTGIALCMLPGSVCVGYDPLLHLRNKSRELLALSEAINDTSTLQETYMCYAILNWPTPVRLHSLDIEGLGKVLEKWKEANSITKTSQMGQEKHQHTKSTKVLLYIGVEHGVERIWLEKPTDNSSLEWFEGTIVSEGQQVSFEIGEPMLYSRRVEIPTAKACHRSNWYKSVFFALGFTLSGPLADSISAEDPRKSRGGCTNVGAVRLPVSPSTHYSTGFVPGLPPNFYLEPPSKFAPMVPRVHNQQPGYPVSDRFYTPPGIPGPFDQSPPAIQHTPRSRFRGGRTRHPSGRGGQRGQ